MRKNKSTRDPRHIHTPTHKYTRASCCKSQTAIKIKHKQSTCMLHVCVYACVWCMYACMYVCNYAPSPHAVIIVILFRFLFCCVVCMPEEFNKLNAAYHIYIHIKPLCMCVCVCINIKEHMQCLIKYHVLVFLCLSVNRIKYKHFIYRHFSCLFCTVTKAHTQISDKKAAYSARQNIEQSSKLLKCNHVI